MNPEVTAFHDRMFDYVPYDTLFLLYGDPAVLLKRAQDRQVELHQAAKKWNTVEKAHEISKKFMDKFGQDPRTVLVPADTPLTSFERFDRYVGPAIIEQSKGTLRFDRNAIVRRLREQYPEGQGSLY